MAKSEASDKPIATPRQLLVVGILGVVLFTVLIMQFGGATSQSSDAAGKARPAKKTPSPAGQASGPKSFARAAEDAAPKPARAPWPKISAEVAAQYDPFAVPEPLARKITEVKPAKEARKPQDSLPKRDIRAENVAALKAKGIALIVHSKRGSVAMVGNRAVRVGDTLEGHRVVAIDSRGVLLAPANRQESHEVHK